MKSTKGRRTACSLAVAAVLAAAAACTSSAPSDDRPARSSREATPATSVTVALRAAERSTEEARSARVRSVTVMGTQLSIKGDGVIGWGDGLTGAMTITYTGGTVADTMRDMGVTSMQARYLADAYYAHMGDRFAARMGGRHWVKYAYEDLKALGGGANFADQMRSTTPDQSVKLLLDSADLRKVGEEKMDGQSATHYSGTVAVADVSDPELRGQLERAGVTTETVDIWVNDKNLLVKKVEKSRTAAEQITQTAHYSDYGVKVSVEKPPAADTEDFKALLKPSAS
ncbi:LppX_LprAFG lipoprotein [Streptomyces sp. S.PB5]|uniref:LppX_LprAFG lipoprotein n=1 Tax=Streptomyces sp. S.PB5 TaxID=3020844 RepID=UPI0025B17DF3|nr:LppX_LprAFG lipoprotein [Streptomyces sp. S.PB5]MDN3024679.1 LppX_LprAFG lipoprotein [Streptomyces sp. S.PB5]